MTTINDPGVTLTESAAAQLKRMLAAEPDAAHKGLRLYIERGGCSGLQYGMAFGEAQAGDLTTEQHGIPVFVDPASADYLRGSVIDFRDELNDSGFKILNPQARQSCGCGKSFAA